MKWTGLCWKPFVLVASATALAGAGCVSAANLDLPGNSSEALANLSDADYQQICEAESAARSQALGKDGVCRYAAVLAASIAGYFDGEDEFPVEACQDDYQACLTQPVPPPECDTYKTPGMATCDATLAELEQCLQEELDTLVRLAPHISCASGDNPDVELGCDIPSGECTPTCRALEEQCPDIFEEVEVVEDENDLDSEEPPSGMEQVDFSQGRVTSFYDWIDGDGVMWRVNKAVFDLEQHLGESEIRFGLRGRFENAYGGVQVYPAEDAIVTDHCVLKHGSAPYSQPPYSDAGELTLSVNGVDVHNASAGNDQSYRIFGGERLVEPGDSVTLTFAGSADVDAFALQEPVAPGGFTDLVVPTELRHGEAFEIHWQPAPNANGELGFGFSAGWAIFCSAPIAGGRLVLSPEITEAMATGNLDQVGLWLESWSVQTVRVGDFLVVLSLRIPVPGWAAQVAFR